MAYVDEKLERDTERLLSQAAARVFAMASRRPEMRAAVGGESPLQSPEARAELAKLLPVIEELEQGLQRVGELEIAARVKLGPFDRAIEPIFRKGLKDFLRGIREGVRRWT